MGTRVYTIIGTRYRQTDGSLVYFGLSSLWVWVLHQTTIMIIKLYGDHQNVVMILRSRYVSRKPSASSSMSSNDDDLNKETACRETGLRNCLHDQLPRRPCLFERSPPDHHDDQGNNNIKWNRETINSWSPFSLLLLHPQYLYLRTVTSLASLLSTFSTSAVIRTLIVAERSVMVRNSLFRSMKMSLAINTNDANWRKALLSVRLVTASSSLSLTGVWPLGTLSTSPGGRPLRDGPSWPSVTSFDWALLLCGGFRAIYTGFTTRCTNGILTWGNMHGHSRGTGQRVPYNYCNTQLNSLYN